MSKRKRQKEKKEKKMSAARRRAEQHGEGFERTALEVPEGVKLWGLKDDKTKRIDVLNYRVGKGNPWADEGELHYERTFWVHRGIGPNSSSYVCPAKTANQPCPICEHINTLDRTDPDEDETAKKLFPRERQIFNIIDTEDENEEVQLWEVSFHLFGKKLDARIRNADDDDEYDCFADWEGGKTLKIGVSEKTFGGRNFYEVDDIDFKSRDDYDPEQIEDEIYCLDDLLKVLPYDELKEVFLQEPKEDSDEEEEKKGKKKKKRTRKKQKDEEEEEIEEPEDEDPEPEFDEDETTDDSEGEDEDEWDFEEPEEESEEEPKEECPWKVGQKVMAPDEDGTMYEGKITSVDVDEGEVEVEFEDDEVAVYTFDEIEAKKDKKKEKKTKKSTKKDKKKKTKKKKKK